MVVTGNNSEASYLQGLFRKYAKRVKDFKVAGIFNQKPLPCEVFEACHKARVIVASFSRLLRAYELSRIPVNYLWLYNLQKTLQKSGPGKVRSKKVFKLIQVIEKIDDFPILWRRAHIEIVYVTSHSEEILSQVVVSRLSQDYLTFRFDTSELVVKKSIPVLRFLRCKNRAKSLKWVLSDNIGLAGKDVYVFTKTMLPKVKKIVRNLEAMEKCLGQIWICEESVPINEIQVWVNVEYPGLLDFQQQLNSLPPSTTIITLISNEDPKDLMLLQYFLRNFTSVTFPQLNINSKFT